jgi:hypothetical protein
MAPSRGMGDMNPEKLEAIKMKSGGKVSRVNEAGNYTKPGMRKAIFERIKAGGKGGAPGQWSARKAQMMPSSTRKLAGAIKIESASEKPEGLGRSKMENQKW